MIDRNRTRGAALMFGVAMVVLMAVPAAAGAWRAGLSPLPTGDVIRVSGEGGEGGDDIAVDPMPGEDDGMMWIGGDPDFCEACGGEIVDGGDGRGGEPYDGEPGVADGEPGPDDTVYDSEPVAMTTTVAETRSGGMGGMIPNGGGGEARSADRCVVPHWRRDREALCNGN